MPSDDGVVAPAAYDLTDFTGRKKNAERVFFVQNYEVNLFTSYVVGASIIAGLPLAVIVGGIVAIFAPAYALVGIVCPIITVFVGLALVDQRSKRGLQLRNYQAIKDRKTATTERETIYIAGEPLIEPEIHLLAPQFVLSTAGTPNEAPAAGTTVPLDAELGKASILDA